jgi:hypothetical protein
MRTLPLYSAFLLGGAVGLYADDSLAHARQAQAMLGRDVWSQVIRIENATRHSYYPRTLHALVFELEGVLWFYSDTDGTQSFSLQRGRLAEEKADIGPLLRDIEPGFTHWSVVPGAVGVAEAPSGPLPNGCFIQSVAASRALGVGAEHRQLLSYYVRTTSGLRGHTVLTYKVSGRLGIFDPEQPLYVQKFPETLGRDALTLARAVRGSDVIQARLFPLDGLEGPATDYTMAATAGGTIKATQSWSESATLPSGDHRQAAPMTKGGSHEYSRG